MRFARPIAMLAIALCVAACGGSGGGGAGDPNAPVTVQVFGDTNEIAAYRELVAAYKAETGRTAQLLEAPDRDAHIQKITTGFAAGRPPDVFLSNYRNFAPFAARGGIDPAGPRLDTSRTLRRADFYAEPIEAFTYRGKLQCLPQNASSVVVFYNQDIFEREGVPFPKDDWTYEDLRETARRLTEPPQKGTQVRRYGVGIDPGTLRLAPFLWTAGGDLVDDPNDPGRFTIDTPEGRTGLQAFLDLQGGDRSAPFEQEVDAKPLAARFLDGQLAMFLSTRRDVTTFRAVEAFEWDVAPFPVVDQPASVLDSDAYCVARGPRADAAWRFVEFAAGESGQRLLARTGRIVPSLRRVAESRDFLDPEKPPRSSQVFLDAIPRARRLPVASTWPEIEDAADLAIKRAYYTELTVDETLATIAEETGPLLEEARAGTP